jgi:hypothetical protein
LTLFDPELARRESRSLVTSYGLEVPDHRPLLGVEEVADPRPVDDVIARCRALYCVLAVVEGVSASEVSAFLAESSLSSMLSESEREYVNAGGEGPRAEHLRPQLSWRTECMLAMGWALHLFANLPLEGVAGEIAGAFAPLDPDGRAGGVQGDIRLRPPDELGQKLDTLYCLHWVVRERQLTGWPAVWPDSLVPGAIWERRHALEWIVQSDVDEWDEVDLST